MEGHLILRLHFLKGNFFFISLVYTLYFLYVYLTTCLVSGSMKGVCSKCEDEEDGEPVYQGIHEIKKDQDEEMRKLKVNLMLGLLPQ